MAVASQEQILIAAQAARDAGRWDEAIRLFSAALVKTPASAQIRHNLALCHFGGGALDEALKFAQQAASIRPELWQSRMIEAKVHRARGRPVDAEVALSLVLRMERTNAAALAAMADLDLNEFGDPAAAVARLAPLRGSPDAELTALMAGLYLGHETAEMQSARLIAFSKRHLRIAPVERPKPAKRARKRVGLISPLFSASPVFFMTFNAFEALAKDFDLVCFNRGGHRDWATERFVSISREWHEVKHMEPKPLAQAIAAADIDVLFDLGGWTDAASLAALSGRPAPRMFSWVGGQSATTGLDMFDGWIGDEWQSPTALQPLYAEKIVNIRGGYSDYRPPAIIEKMRRPGKRSGVALVGNPCKIGPAMMKAWPEEVRDIRLIDRRYAHARTRDRVIALLNAAGVRNVEVIVPGGHADYLEALSATKTIVNTAPYSAGLTAIEASALGVELLTLPIVGKLFCERHHLSHRVTGGRNPGLAGEIGKLILS
jgi:protein O-GlcNAc transferase